MKDLGLSYSLGEGSSTQPIGYCNAHWGNDVEDWRSTSGINPMLAGGPISWSTQKKGSIATSTCEAELNSLDEAAKQARCLQELLLELGLLEEKPTALFNDNPSALAAIKRREAPTDQAHRNQAAWST